MLHTVLLFFNGERTAAQPAGPLQGAAWEEGEDPRWRLWTGFQPLIHHLPSTALPLGSHRQSKEKQRTAPVRAALTLSQLYISWFDPPLLHINSLSNAGQTLAALPQITPRYPRHIH